MTVAVEVSAAVPVTDVDAVTDGGGVFDTVDDADRPKDTDAVAVAAAVEEIDPVCDCEAVTEEVDDVDDVAVPDGVDDAVAVVEKDGSGNANGCRKSVFAPAVAIVVHDFVESS